MNWLLMEQLLLQALPALIQGIQTVQKATGVSPEAATIAVVNHLTPGEPAAPALSPNAKPV